MIEFKRLEISNFLSFGEKQILPLSGQGIVRVEGKNLDEPDADSNKAGKSAIIEALVWALFGRTIRGVKHDHVVNRFAKRNCCVSVSFSIGGKKYKVVRHRRHRKNGNALHFWRGDALLSARHDEETQKKLEAAIGVDYQTFTNSVIFGGARPFAALTDAEQKKVLESFLHFREFDEALRRAKNLIVEGKERLHGLEVEVSEESEKVKGLRNHIASLRKSERIFRRSRQGQIDELNEELEEAKKSLAKLAKRRVSALPKGELEQAEERVEQFVSRISALTSRVRLERKNLRALKESVRDREKLVGKPCPTCRRIITERTLSAYLDHVRSDRGASHNKIAGWRDKIADLERRLAYGRKDLNRLQQKHRSQELERKSQTVKKQDLGERVSLVHEKLRKLRSSGSPFREEIEDLTKQYSRRISRHLVLSYQQEQLEKRLADLRFWEEGFGNRGVKSLVIRESLPALNMKLAEYSNDIFQGSAELRFVPSRKTKRGEERELFHVDYSARKGSSSYLGESSGGRKRADICVLLAFAWLSRTANLLLVDELLDGLDETGRECVLHILAKLRGTVLVISHRTELKARLGKVWVVTKKNGFSRVRVS